MVVSNDKKIIIIAGPNGAVKTTFANEFLPNQADCINFVNTVLIAAGISPYAPAPAAAFKAGRIMLQEIENYADKEKSFAFETTLSGCHYATRIPTWRASGYTVATG